MTASELVGSLESVRARGPNKWGARCPAHADKSPSLSIREGDDGRLLVHCFAGCTIDEITSALGLRVSDLFTDATISRGQRAPNTIPRIDRRAIAFHFEICALDLRLRAEKIFRAARTYDVADLDEPSLDRLMRAVTSGYADIERAELMEHVADTLRWKAFQERTIPHAA